MNEFEEPMTATEAKTGAAEGKKGKARPSVLSVVRQLIDRYGAGKLAQVGPHVQRDTESEAGWVEDTSRLERDACNQIGCCPRRAGVMSALESFIAVPQATAYRATPYFFWREVEGDTINSHWEPLVLKPTELVFADGILDLATNEFRDWTAIKYRVYGPKIMMTYADVINAKPTSQFNTLQETLRAVLPDDEVRSYFGFVMSGILRPHVNIKKAIFIQGPAGSRKSTVATALLCAPAGASGYSIEEIDYLAERPFAQANLIGRWANLSDDPDGKADKWVGWFKRYTGSSIMRGEFKYHQSRNFPITAKLIVCCNAIPKMGDSSDAVWSRLCVFRFQRDRVMEQEFKHDTADNSKLHAEYWSDPATRAMVLSWLLTHAKSSIAKGGTPAPAKVLQWNAEACGEADPVRGVLEDMLERSDNDADFIVSSELNVELEHMGFRVTPNALSSYVQTLFDAGSDRRHVKQPSGQTLFLRGFKGVKRKHG